MAPVNERQLADPQQCLAAAARLTIPVTGANWELVREDADALNLLTAALTHQVYLGPDEDVPETILALVYTAYLLGRNADDRAAPEAFAAFIAGLDLSGL